MSAPLRAKNFRQHVDDAFSREDASFEPVKEGDGERNGRENKQRNGSENKQRNKQRNKVGLALCLGMQQILNFMPTDEGCQQCQEGPT